MFPHQFPQVPIYLKRYPKMNYTAHHSPSNCTKKVPHAIRCMHETNKHKRTRKQNSMEIVKMEIEYNLWHARIVFQFSRLNVNACIDYSFYRSTSHRANASYISKSVFFNTCGFFSSFS
jgi:hypothetical protein